jgi:hypothetical protein
VILTFGATASWAQGVPAIRQAPVGHRQPTASDLPPDVRKDEQLPSATPQPPSAPPSSVPQPSSATPQSSGAPLQRQTRRNRGVGPPTLQVGSSCEAAGRGAVVLGRNKEACLADETIAQTTLRQNWPKYLAADKTTCIGMETAGGPASYVELLSCLEVLRDAKDIQAADPLEDDLKPVGMRPGDGTHAPRTPNRRADRGRRHAS